MNAGTDARASRLHRPRPPPVFPLAEHVAQLRHHLIGEQLGVVPAQIFAHIAELQQHHQVSDVQVARHFADLLRHLVRRTDNHVAPINDRIHFTRNRREARACVDPSTFAPAAC